MDSVACVPVCPGPGGVRRCSFYCLSLLRSTCAGRVVNCDIKRALRTGCPLRTLQVNLGRLPRNARNLVRRSSHKYRCTSCTCMKVLDGGKVSIDVARDNSPGRGTVTRHVGDAVGGRLFGNVAFASVTRIGGTIEVTISFCGGREPRVDVGVVAPGRTTGYRKRVGGM